MEKMKLDSQQKFKIAVVLLIEIIFLFSVLPKGRFMNLLWMNASFFYPGNQGFGFVFVGVVLFISCLFIGRGIWIILTLSQKLSE